MKKPGKRFPIAALGMGLAAMAYCGVGHAQDQTNTVVVTQDTTNTAAYSDVAEGINEAVRRYRQDGAKVRVEVLGGADVVYTVNNPIMIPADADIHIMGVLPGADGDNSSSRPWEVVLEAGSTLDSEPLIHIHTEESAFTGDNALLNYRRGNNTDNILIEGLTLRGADTGIRIGSDTPPPDGATLAPQISRCIILGSEAATHKAGIDVRVNGAPTVANSVVGAYDVPYGDGASTYDSNVGIRVGSNGALDLFFSTILFNDEAGIWVDQDAGRVRIRNTLVYDNGADIDDNTQGGIVFESNPFITPSSGPYDDTTTVTISGLNFTAPDEADPDRTYPDVTAVYFGPPDSAGTDGTDLTLVSPSSLEVEAPQAYNGEPGPVDVTIERGDGQQIMLEQAFTYMAGATPPSVASVDPTEGPCNTSGTWIVIEGSNFEPHSEVRFDMDVSGGISVDDLASPRVQWFSSSYLFVQVPEHDAAVGPLDVFVRTSAGVSPADGASQFTYTDSDVPPPVITQIAPDIVRGVDPPATPVPTVNIIGWNFGPNDDDGVVVRIDGNDCDYEQIIRGDSDPNGDSFDEITGVEVPVTDLTEAGKYDVEVVNADGQRALLPQGLTYFPGGTPELTQISPNAISRQAANEAGASEGEKGVYFTIYGENFGALVTVLFDVDGDEVFEFEGEVFATSPSKIVVKAPPSDPSEGLGLTDADYEDDGQVEVAVRVFNGRQTDVALGQGLDSNAKLVYYFDDDTVDPLATDAPVLEFNDVHLNSRDYVNASPGTGSISVDPMLDPGPAEARAIGPKVIQRDAEDWWLGKLALSSVPGAAMLYSPLRDKAGDFSLGLFAFEDLELEGRPNYVSFSSPGGFYGQGPADTPKSDIGADEINEDGQVDLTWYFAEISPSPIGRAGPEEVEVEVRIRGLSGSLPEEEGFLFLVPQGGDPGEPLHRIPFKINESDQISPNTFSFIATNTEAIETDIARNEGGGNWSAPAAGQTRQPGDLVADGHGALFVFVPNALSSFLSGTETIAGYSGLGRILGYTERDYADDGLLTLRDEGFISGDAVDGRHVLIDTTPPRIFVEAYPIGLIGPWDLVDAAGTNDTFSINRSDLDLVGPANHAGLNLPAETWPAGNWFNLNPYMGITKPGSLINVPAEWQGVLQNIFRIGGNLPARDTKVQVFFNTGSISNGLALPSQNDADDNLDFTVVVRFVDPVVTVASPQGVPYFDEQNYVVAGGSNFGPHTDRYTGLRNRQVSGFDAGTETFADLQDLSDEALLPAVWHIAEGLWGGYKNGASASAEFSANAADEYSTYPEDVNYPLSDPGAVASNTGFNPNVPGSATAANNNELRAEWDVQNLDWNAAQQAAFRMAVQFRGRDRAGNETELDSLLEPLYLNWGLGVQTEFTQAPTAANGYLARWGLRRGQAGSSGPPTMPDPDTEEGPAPLFMYRLFINYESPGLPDGRYWHVYTSQWTTRTSLNEDDLRQILNAGGFNPDVNQYYLMLAVLGADEAGNVEPWLREVPYWTISGLAGVEGDPLFDAPFQPVNFRGVGTPERRSVWAGLLPNIVRFSWTGAEVPDTTVSPVFWHGDGATPIGAPDERLGSNLRVVLPEEGSGQTVDAQFILGAEYQDRTDLRIVWELYEAGGARIAYGDVGADAPPVEVFDLGDPNRREAITYTFRAAAYYDNYLICGTQGVFDEMCDPIDPTWANVSFVVTPYAVDPGLDPLDQPIKVTEEQ